MTNQEILKRLQALEAAERDVASSMDMPQECTANWEYAETAILARSAILQQQEGLANYAQENERLRELLAAFEELLALDSENCPGTDLYDVMLQTGSVLRSEPQTAPHAAEQYTK